MRTNTTLLYRAAFVVLSLVLLLAGAACSRTTPPGADAVGGSLDGTSYTFLRWQQGLRVMLWYDDARGFGASGGGSTDDPTYYQEAYAETSGGRQIKLQMETQDGKTGTLRLNDQAYDLSDGTLFLVRSPGDDLQVQVQQIERDLSGISPTTESVEAFASNDPDIQAFIEEANANAD